MFDLSLYDYELPSELIAAHPVEPRDHSRLMVISRESGEIRHFWFYELPQVLPKDSLLIANDSRVIPARFIGKRRLANGSMGGRVEALLLEKKSDLVWEALLQAARKGREGLEFEVETPDGEVPLIGRVVRDAALSEIGSVEIAWSRDPLSSGAGLMPLPPYIDREASVSDRDRYQTVYSREEGSAAAPTAGLHFTPDLIAKLKQSGMTWATLTLHVGVGTFRPIKTEDVRSHSMHEEFFSVSPETALQVTTQKREGKPVIAIGTTSVRSLESAWDASSHKLREGASRTRAYFYPGGPKIECINGLITNFHLPKSSLLLLVSALAGRELIQRAYREAIDKKYRFFSYGDAMLIL